jgi:hypothetical protein
MLEEKTIDEVKHAKILSLNAACDPYPDDIKGTGILNVTMLYFAFLRMLRRRLLRVVLSIRSLKRV